MAIDINAISINVNGLDDWFDYAEVLQELADEVDAFRQNNRDKLSNEQKKSLRFYAKKIRKYASDDIATIAAIEKLEELDTELTQLKDAVKKIDGFLAAVTNTKKAISGLAEIVGVIVNIIDLVA